MTILRRDRTLFEGFRAGKPEALGTVYRVYVRKVEHLLSQGFELRGQGTRVSGVGHRPDDLADLVQEVFLRAFSEKARRSYDGLRDYGPYLFAIARNVLVDQARAHGREILSSQLELDVAIEPMAPEDAPFWAEPATMMIVEAYLAALPQDMREVHRLRYEAGLSQEQAAEKLGVGRQTRRQGQGQGAYAPGESRIELAHISLPPDRIQRADFRLSYK